MPEAYCRAVEAGQITAGRLVQAAVERHRRDLREGAARGLTFDPRAAARVLTFFAHLRHSKGEWVAQRFTPSAWQRFLLASIFGWKRADGFRRFRRAYVEVARKNGKSTLAAGIGLYMLVSDEEPGAEVYSAATTRDQARIVFDEASRMVKASPALARRLTSFRNNLHIAETASKFQALSSDWNTLDGLNIHGALVDELHAHASRELWDVIETSVAARRQPLILGITTAGQETVSVCGQLHHHAVSVLNGSVEDDAFFAFVANLDRGDDWTNPAVWPKANPNLGISVKLEALVDQVKRARAEPAAQNAFRRLHLNEWISAESSFIDPAVWSACAGPRPPAEILAGLARPRAVYGGLDLASTIDLAALALIGLPEAGGPFEVYCRFYMPEEVARDPEKRRRDRVPYDAWVDAGWITATPGNVIDYAWIRKDLERFAAELSLLQVGYDPWNATQFATEAQEELGLEMVPIRQGVISLSAPTKELLKLAISGRLAHGGNPVLAWQAANLVVRVDHNGNVAPTREKGRSKIDGIVATIMALDRALRNEGSPLSGSVYSRGGLAAL